MRCVAGSREIKRAMRVAMGILPVRTPMEVLRSVKISCDDEMHVIATDSTCSIKVLVPGAQVEEPGDVLVPGKRGHQIVQRSEDEVLFASTKSGVRIEVGQDKFEMLSDPVSVFPTVRIDPVSPDYCHEMQADALEKAIRRTVFAADPLYAKYALGGTAFDLQENGPCFFVGSDGRRISAQRLEATGHGGHSCDPKTTIAPTAGMKSLSESIRFLEAEQARICCGASCMTAESESFSLACQWLEGRFPSPWQRTMVPKDSDKHADASCYAGELLEAVRKSEIMADETTVGVVLAFEGEEIRLTRSGECVGTSKVVVEADVLGEPSQFQVNPSYLKEWLNSVDPGDQVSIRYPLMGAMNIQLSVEDGGYYTQSIMLNVEQVAPSV